MNQLDEALSISIIGGADGPTTIYILNPWLLVIELIILTALFVFAIFGFIKNIKKRKIVKSVVFGIIALSVILFISISAARTHKTLKENLKESIDLYENLFSSESYTNLGIYTEAEDVVKESYGSGVPVAAEQTEIATLKDNVLQVNDDEYFILENHILKYFNKEKEYRIYSIEDN